MDNFFWYVFEKSGSIDAIMAYMKYNEVTGSGYCKNSGDRNKRNQVG